MTEPYAVPVPKGYRVGVWEVHEPIATGAFGSVYAARRTDRSPRATELPASAALKFLPTGTNTPRQLAHLRELVEREVALYRRLDQPRLIRMYDTLVVDDPDRPTLDGATVLVLEQAQGSLSALLATSPRPDGGPALLAQICEGLAQLHTAGWVHGDLKPANVLLMPDGSARLGDFNMAAELEGTHAYTPAFSTPDYTPPELLWAEIGDRGRRIRPSADVWAFGVLAHLVLTGAFPLPGATPTARRDAATSYARGTDELRLSPELPDDWREIVCACLARTHADRITTQALSRRVEAAAGTARPSRLGRSPRRRRGLSTVVASAVAVAALAYGIGLWTAGGKTDASNGDAALARYGASELRTDQGIPVQYRRLIVDSAHACSRPDVTPVLVAAMLKSESNFDPNLSDPGKQEFGIARWTPAVLRWWMQDNGVPASATPTPPLTPSVSIPAMGRYLCYIDDHLKSGLPGDERVLVAAGYRTSAAKVNDTGGVPPKYRDYCARVAHYLKEYAPPGRK
ncbi:serine/threonine-protein kinase [Streptomyces broussonetiae]|uniref:non-specific serine/threonine protein kinase n=1 Tax=Streptomyces broussonetiae TaxID=2686304 RepID=A0A6I6N6R7_9ACTN|nr:serine/threonine-protein kinase [Streptomyces broussonetiae]QHA06389.1 protein kinase [Streptomyces broussonetiae]